MPTDGASSSARGFAFSSFVFEPLEGTLEHDGQVTNLRNQTSRALELLLRGAGAVVSREELRQRLWGDEVHVDFDQGINTCIREIRAALGSSPDDLRFVETLPGRGYRFLAPVEILGPEACFTAEAVPPRASAGPARSSMDDPGSDLRRRRRWLVPTLCVACGLGATFVGMAWLAGHREAVRPRAGKTGSVRVVVGAFENRTGEALLDDSLETAFLIGLQRHRGLAFVPSDQLHLTLARMHRSSDATLDRALSLEVAQRLNADVVIVGQTLRVGREYLVTAEAIEPADGASLHAVTEQVRSQGELLGALDRLADEVGDGLVGGEALASARASHLSLSQVTTPSLEALKAYSLGERAVEAGRTSEGRASFKRAIELDPGFAMAHARLAVVYRNEGHPVEAIRHLRLAKRSANRLTELEALYVDGWLASMKPDPDRAMALWRLMAEKFPTSPIGRYNGAMVRYIMLGDLEGCVDELSHLIEASGPGFYPLSVHQARVQCLVELGRNEEALADLRALLAAETGTSAATMTAIEMLVALGLGDEAQRRVDAFEVGDGSDAAPVWRQSARALLALDRGHEENAFAEFERAASLARELGMPGLELSALFDALSVVELGRWLAGDTEAPEQRIVGRIEELLASQEIRALADVIRADALFGSYLARKGRIADARRVRRRLDDLRRRRGVGTLWQGYVDLLDSELELTSGRPAEAVRILEQSVTEAPGPPFHGRGTLARAYRVLGDEVSAERVEQWIADHRGRAYVDQLGADINLEVARNILCFQRAVEAVSRLHGRNAGGASRTSEGGRSSVGSIVVDPPPER